MKNPKDKVGLMMPKRDTCNPKLSIITHTKTSQIHGLHCVAVP